MKESGSKFKRCKLHRPIIVCALLQLEPLRLLHAGSGTLGLHNMLVFILNSALVGLAGLCLWLYLKNPYILNDLQYSITSLSIAMKIRKIEKEKPFYSILDCFQEKVAKQPQKTFLLFEGTSISYSQADRTSNRLARALQEHGHLKEGDTVALLMENEPNFVFLWLALAKLGCTASLLNNNIRSKSLLHCFSCCDAKVLVAGAGIVSVCLCILSHFSI